MTADPGTSSDSTSTDHDNGGSSPASADHEELGDTWDLETEGLGGDTESVDEESDENKDMHYTVK